jgi:small subunit ribosomal protein S4e
MHLKRNLAPKTWPIPRKGTKLVVIPNNNRQNGIPLLVILRDIMKIAGDRREAKKIVHDKKVSINGKTARDEKSSLLLFDLIEIDNRRYRIVLEKGKFKLKETKDEGKIVKVIGKKILPGGKVQLNFNDGRNLISKEKISTGDSVLINTKTKKIDKILNLEEGASFVITRGKHLGEESKVEKINEDNSISVVINGKKANLKIENIMVIK